MLEVQNVLVWFYGTEAAKRLWQGVLGGDITEYVDKDIEDEEDGYRPSQPQLAGICGA